MIGNPPYIRIQALKEWAPQEVEFYKQRYVAASKGNYDIYVVFVEKGLSLLNPKGRLGFILPHKFFNAQYGQPLRGLIAQGKHLSKVVHFGDQQVFDNATTYTCLLFLSKSNQNSFKFEKVDDIQAWRNDFHGSVVIFDAQKINTSEWNLQTNDVSSVLLKFEDSSTRLGDISKIFVGTQTSADDIFVLDDCIIVGEFVEGYSKSLRTRVKIELLITKPFLYGKQIRKYQPITTQSRLICPYYINGENSRLMDQKELMQFPLAYKYLSENKSALAKRENGKFKGINWYGFGYPKSMTSFQKEKLIVPDYNNAPSCTLDQESSFFKTGYGILIEQEKISKLYVLGLLNSTFLYKYLLSVSTTLRGGYVRFWTQYLQKLPIRLIDFNDPADVKRHERMVALVENMLGLHKRLAAAGSPQEKELLQRQIGFTDREIDALVYELYGLTEEEIRIVEGA